MRNLKCQSCGHINPTIGEELIGQSSDNIREIIKCDNCGEMNEIIHLKIIKRVDDTPKGYKVGDVISPIKK